MINVSIPQAVWIACNDLPAPEESTVFMFQYRKRYGLHAMQKLRKPRKEVALFQYRKRYGLHAMGYVHYSGGSKSAFQYRKRYGLHAIIDSARDAGQWHRFNTASGMDCMQ